MVFLPRTIPWKRTGSPCPRSHVSVDPELWVGFHAFLLTSFWYFLFCLKPERVSCILSQPLSVHMCCFPFVPEKYHFLLIIHCRRLSKSLSASSSMVTVEILEKQIWYRYFFKDWASLNFLFSALWPVVCFVLITLYCKEKLLWWELRNALMSLFSGQIVF